MPRDVTPSMDAFVFDVGERVQLQNGVTGHVLDLLVEPVRHGVMLAQVSQPYSRLQRSSQRKTVVWKQTAGNAYALWSILQNHSAVDCSKPPAVHVVAAIAPSLRLAMNHEGDLILCEEGEEDEGRSMWWLQQGATSLPMGLHNALGNETPMRDVLGRGYTCGVEEGNGVKVGAVQNFARDGFLVLPGLVGHSKVEKALRYLNHHLGSASLAEDLEPDGLGMEFEGVLDEVQPASGVVKLGSGRRCHCCLAQAAPLLDLIGAKEREVICAALGSSRPILATFGCQLALRFPLRPFTEGVLDGEAALPLLLPHAQLQWHTDAAKYNEKKSFDIVLGVFLNALPSRDRGNLWVQPGSHVQERADRESADGKNAGLRQYTAEEAHAILAPDPGTVIVFDKDLVHAGGPNLSPNIRYALYYRVRFEP